MREIKEFYHNKEERLAGHLLCNKWVKESGILLDDYLTQVKPLEAARQAGEITFEEYKEKRKPILDAYKAEDERIYKEYVRAAREMNYDAGEE